MTHIHSVVIPAPPAERPAFVKTAAGIQLQLKKAWTPAFAGVTKEEKLAVAFAGMTNRSKSENKKGLSPKGRG